ncbi:TonB-dependent siderophore receptor [Paracoccus sediminis]|uniref:Iron complex outermembrane recepter protein n=1 Tax=Paracoccus sediminis TaxID=1214787 RepID=A0A238VFZ0_9RHOB|nr:TonB-dependent siderophore receptor [Paracoccus sediminis]SNR32997.1 iron complex outermembrane recepter protein [Paracoccus sediminis]
MTRGVVAYSSTAGSGLATPILDTPASVSVVTANEIARRGARTAEEVLRYATGVTTDFYGGDDRFDYYKLRGFDASVYRDGLPMQKAFGGIREDAFAYERVEIVKGGNSTVNGPSEPGGIVNYATKLPRAERFGEAYVGGGSFGRAEAGVDFGDILTPDAALAYRLTARVQKSDKELDHSRDDATLVMGGLTWRPTDRTRLSVVADYLDRDGSTGSGWPTGTNFARDVFFGEPDFNYVDNTRRAVSVLLDHDFGNGLAFNAKARHQSEDRGFGYVYIWDADGVSPADRYYFANAATAEQTVADATLQYDATFGGIASRTLVGLQYSDVESDSTSWYTTAVPADYTGPVYAGGIDLDRLAPYARTIGDDRVASVYLQQELTVSDRLIASVGLRHDRMDLSRTALDGTRTTADFSKTTRSVGLTYKITPDLSAYASYAESVLPAALTVEPEEGRQVEAGVKYRPAGLDALFTAAVYDLRKTNITRNDASTNPPIPRTIGEIRACGIELEARAELPGDLSVIAAYAYADTEITDRLSSNRGNSLGNVPRHLASVWLDYTWAGQGARGDMTFGIGARYKGTAFGGDDNTAKSEAAVLIDAAYGYDVTDDTRLAVNVTNLLDEKHREAASGAITYNPGREIGVTLRRTW